MFYEQRGPLVFSASVHLVLLVGAAIWVLFFSEQEKKPFQFELVPPPSGGAAQQTSESLPTLDSIKYERVEDSMPTLDDIQVPERPVRTVEVELPPEPVVKREQPVVETAPPKPKPKPMSIEDFLKQNPDANEIKNVRTTPAPTRNSRPDIKVPQFKGIEIGNLPPAEIASYSQAEQDAIGSYIAGFKARLQRAVDNYPSQGSQLSVLVSCDILANGTVTNVRIISPSKDSGFNNMVVAAYKRSSPYARPPHGKELRDLRIEFVQKW